MKLAIQTSRLPGASLLDKFANAGRFGFDAVEVSIGPDFDLYQRFDEVKAAAGESGVPVCAICTHSIHDPLHPDAATRVERFTGLARLLALAEALGANGVISVPVRRPHVFPDLTDPDRETMELAAAEFTQWAQSLPDGKSAVFLEPLNRYESMFLRRVEQAVELATRIGHPRVVALADLFHMNIEESDLGEPVRATKRLLGHVHIADNNRLQPGAGCLDFRTPFDALKTIGYDGFISIECSALGGPLAAGGAEVMLPETVRFLRRMWEAA